MGKMKRLPATGRVLYISLKYLSVRPRISPILASDPSFIASKPNILQFVQSILDVPRTEYSRDFALVTTSGPNSAALQSYRAGLIFLMCLISAVWFVWTALLIWLKCNGKSVGCAAGHSFDSFKASQPGEKEEEDVCSASEGEDGDAISETSSISNESLEDGTADPLEDDMPKQEKERELDGGSVEENASFQSSFRSAYTSVGGDYSMDENASQPQQPKALASDNTVVDDTQSLRARRTRICFLFFGLVTLACVPLIFVFSFKPMVAAEDESNSYVSDSRAIISEATAALENILSASSNSSAILENLPMDLDVICPNISAVELEAELAVNLESMVGLVRAKYARVESQVAQNVSDVQEVLLYYEDAINLVESAYDKAAPYFWLVPTILFSLTAFTAVAMIGVFLAWKRQSNRGFQRFLSSTVLPSLMVLSLACWVGAITSAVTSAVGSDACLSGSSTGSPDETFSNILLDHGFDANSPAYDYLTAYMTGCGEGDPAVLISDLRNTVQSVSSEIWQALGQVNAVGQMNIDFYCNGGNELDKFLAGSLELALLLSASQNLLNSAATSLSCARIHAIYVEAVNDSICTDVASAVAWSFIFFFCLGISTMVMITLRASWLQRINEEKIYDESEVAENMFCDEHEEYLAYISKYKHEWEEYQGLDAALAEPPIQTGSTEQSSSSQSNSDGNPSEHTSDVESSVAEAFDPYNSSTDAQSLATTASVDNISFLSLNVNSPMNGQQSPTGHADPSVILPSLLTQLSPTENDDAQEFSAHDLMSTTEKRGGPAKASSLSPSVSQASKNTMVPSPTMTSMGKKRPSGLQPVKTSDNDDLLRRLDEIGAASMPIVSTLGTPVCLSEPPTMKSYRPSRMDDSPSSVEFKLRDTTPSSRVKQHVNSFSKSRTLFRPLTPSRPQPAAIKDLAAKFESPP